MDALIYMIFALFIILKVVNSKDTEATLVLEESSASNVERIAKLNDSFYEDPDAFCEIAHALGFPKE